MGLALATPLLGTLAHFMWNASRAKIPLFPDQLHCSLFYLFVILIFIIFIFHFVCFFDLGWFGRITILLSWVTIFLGMDLLGVPYQLLVAFSWVLLAYITAYVWLDVMKIKEIGIRAYFFGAYTKKEEEPQLSDYY